MPGLYDQGECTLQQRERDMWLQRCRHTYIHTVSPVTDPSIMYSTLLTAQSLLRHKSTDSRHKYESDL